MEQEEDQEYFFSFLLQNIQSKTDIFQPARKRNKEREEREAGLTTDIFS
jgi:hypothetical protein